MKKMAKKCLSLVLVLFMVMTAGPMGVLDAFAATTVEDDPQAATEVGDYLVIKGQDHRPGAPDAPTNVPGTHWEFVSKSTEPTCGTDIHVHDDGCYYKKCDHKDGHPSTCYESSTAYAVCPDKDNHAHTNTADITDVVTLNGNNPTWVKTHPAYQAVYAIYKKAYDDAAGGLLGTYGQKLAGAAAIATVTVCYTTTSEPTLCTHTCSELGGSCYLKTCLKTEHAAHDNEKCYSYTWKLVYNTLSPIEVVFEGNTPGVTVTTTLPESAKYNDDITFTLSATGDAYHTWTATINGKDPVKLSATEPTEVTAKNITSGTIKVTLTSEALPTYTIRVVEVNKLNGCAYTLSKSSNLLEGNTANLGVVIPSDENNFKFTPSVAVSGTGASYAGGVITVGTENVTVTIDYQPKKLVVNNSSKTSPVEIPYNFGKGVSAQENAVKQAIFDALVNSGSSLPAGLTSWEQLGYQYYQQNKVTGDYAGESKPFTEGGTLQYEFSEIGGTNYGYVRNTAVEKIKIIWAEGNGLPEVFADVYVKLVDSRPNGVITVDNAAIGNITADEESQITEAAIRAALNNAISAELLNKLTVKVGATNIVPNGTPAVQTTGSVTVTLTLSGTADYKEATKTISIPVINPVYNAKIELSNTNCVIKVYSDAACTVEVTNLNAVAADTYYVKIVSVATGYSAPVPSINLGTLSLQTNGSYSFAVEAADLAANVKTYTLTAAATKNSYTVTWNPNGGNWNGSTDNKVDYVEFEDTVIQPAAPTKEGYTFAGWQPTVVETMGAANVEYIAQWTINQYTINFDSNGGPSVDSITKNFGEAITLPTPGTWTGYTFIGWYTDVELNNKFVGTTMPLNGATLYAKWTAAASSINFETNGGSAVEAITGNFGDAITQPADPTNTGYTFLGWYTDAAFTTPYTFTTLPATPITVYARWEANTYTITWQLNDGTATSWGDTFTNWPTSAEYGSVVSIYIDFDTPIKAGHTFTGFISDQVTVERVDWEGDRAWYRFTMPANDVTIVANYNVNKYTITFVDDDGTTILGAYEVEYGAMPTIPANPTKADTAEWDYTFNGWDNEVVAVSEDKTYKAIYSAVKQKYTITWVVDGVEHNTTIEYGESAVAPTYTVPAYHEFVKWDVTPDTVTGVATYNAVLTLKTSSNPAIGKSDYSAQNLKDKVLTAVGLPTTGNYTVTTEVGVEIPLVGLQTVTVIVNNDSVALQQQRADYDIAQIFAMALADDTSRAFTIVDNETGVSKTLIIVIAENRETPTYTVGKDSFIVNADTVIDVTWLKDNLGINVPSGQGYSIAVVGTVPNFVAGNTYTVTVQIAIVENSNYKGLTEEFDITLEVNDAFVNITGSNNITYNPEMSVENITKYIFENLTVLYNPQALKNMPHTIKYLANEATTVPVTVNLKNLDLSVYASFIPYDTITVDIPVAALWLDIGAEYPETTAPSNAKLEGIFNDLITKYGVDLALGRVEVETLMTEFKAILDADEDLKLYYQYLAAHKFGEMSQEMIKIIVNGGDEHGLVESNTYVINLMDDRDETEIKLNSGVSVVYGKYTKAELLALLVDGVYVNGIRNDALTVELVTDVIGLPASESCEITVKFKGDADYKSSTATTAIVINKAPVSVDVDNQITKYGTEYNKLPVVTSPANVDTIQFIVGLDISDVNINGGVKDILGRVQLLLPEELQEMLVMVDDLIGDKLGKDISFANGASMKLSDLQDAVSTMDGLFENSEYEEYFRILLKMLQSLPTETADIQIIIGGELPSNVGIYVIGAVTADTNYETAFGVGALVIYPDGIKAEIAWNQEDENNIITNSLLVSGAFDTAAHATSVGEGGDIDFATSQILEVFLGVDIYGNITLETDQKKLNVGAYAEIATIVNWGNQMYYSNVLARPIIVAAETLDVEFIDHTGAINNERWFEFDNTAKNTMEGNIKVTYKQDGNGYKAGDIVNLPYSVRYLYVGVQTNGVPYASENAPVHAGTYTVTAIVVITDEDGTISHAGQGIGVLVIEPSKSTIKVDNSIVKWDDSEHKVNSLTQATSVNVPTLTPDTTVISVGVYADLDANIGLDSIKGNVNIDMPLWLDEIIKKLSILDAAYAEGIDASVLINYTAIIRDEIGALDIDTSSFDSIINVIEQLPANAKLTFHDDKSYKEVGMYLIIGVVTDSDHYPAIDAGLMVIHPDYEKAELNWNYNDSNNIFTLDTLSVVDLGAHATINGAHTDKIPFNVVYVGVNVETMEIILTENQADLGIGLYTELAYVVGIDNLMYVAKPIVREIMVVPNIYDVKAEDKTFVYDGEAKDIGEIVVFDKSNQNITANGTLSITYMGITGAVNGYLSNEAPTEAGVYSVIVTFVTLNDNNYPIGVGTKVVTLVIEKADPVFDMKDTEVLYNGSEAFVEVLNNQNVDYVAIVLKENGINLVLTDGLKDLADYLGNEVYDITSFEAKINDAIIALEALNLESAFIDKLLETIKEIDDNMIYKITVNGANPTQAGEYKVYAISVPTANYGVDVSKATLVINPIKIVVSVENTEILVGENPKFNYTIVEGSLANGDELTVDFTKEYDINNVGIYDISAVVTINNNYDVTVIPGILKVNPLTITSANVLGDYIYNGIEQTANIVVKYGNKVLVEGQDYVIEGNKHNDAGNYNITVQGIGNYIGTLNTSWTIAAKEITAADVALAGSQLVYNGSEQTQNVTVADGITYTVSGNTATNVGNYTLTVTFNGNYSGSVELPWSIEAKELTAADVALAGSQLVYNGSEQTQNVTVADGITYTVSGNKATDAGNYTLTVTFNGNYSGSVTLNWSIILLGDADRNGTVDMFDSALILQYYTGENGITADDLDLSVSDVDGNGTVDMFDASLILQYYTREISRFPVEQ